VPDADPAVARLASLAAALEDVARAAVHANPDALAVCEAPLELALASAPAASELAGSDPSVVADQLRRIQHAVSLCRSLGRAATELIAASLSAQGVAPGYLPAGVGAPAPRLGRLEVRV
jgi:hypothetical protein